LAPDGTIWVTNGAMSRIHVFNPEGTLLEVWGERGTGDRQFNFVRANGDGIGGIAFAPDGSFYVTDMGNNRIQHFAADRGFLHTWGKFGTGEGQFSAPIGVVVAPDGNVFVTDIDAGTVQKFVVSPPDAGCHSGWDTGDLTTTSSDDKQQRRRIIAPPLSCDPEGVNRGDSVRHHRDRLAGFA
jgi:sugar lactone lactonase YvrE